MKSKSKYNNKKVVVEGITFDSKKEAKRYLELKQLESDGEISHLELQPKFELIPKNGKERACNYKADFSYIDSEGCKIVEDVKGYKTDVYKLKKKLLLWRYPGLEFREV